MAQLHKASSTICWTPIVFFVFKFWIKNLHKVLCWSLSNYPNFIIFICMLISWSFLEWSTKIYIIYFPVLILRRTLLPPLIVGNSKWRHFIKHPVPGIHPVVDDRVHTAVGHRQPIERQINIPWNMIGLNTADLNLTTNRKTSKYPLEYDWIKPLFQIWHPIETQLNIIWKFWHPIERQVYILWK